MRILVSVLLLVLVTPHLARGSVEAFDDTLRLVTDQTIIFSGVSDSVIVRAGEDARFEWNGQQLLLNGVIIRPLEPYFPEPTIEQLRAFWEGVPSVAQWVAADSASDERSRWTHARDRFDSEMTDLLERVRKQYSARIAAGAGWRIAAENSVELMNAHPFVDHASINESLSLARSVHLKVLYRGFRFAVTVDLPGDDPESYPKPGPTTVKGEDARGLVDTIERLINARTPFRMDLSHGFEFHAGESVREGR